jgi:hypothetical protein
MIRAAVPDTPSPRGWLGLAFAGVWLYLVSQLLRIFPEGAANGLELSIPEALEAFAITSLLGQIVLFAGLTSSLWRANLAAGLSAFSVRGLALGAAGVGVLVSSEIALFLDWIRASANPLGFLVATPVLDAAVIGGTALVFGGLASLGFGLSRAIHLFRRSRREASRAASGSEETV